MKERFKEGAVLLAAFLSGGLCFRFLILVLGEGLKLADVINLFVAIGTLSAVGVALFVHFSAEQKNEEKSRRIAELDALRLKPSIFTLLEQVSKVRNEMAHGGMQFQPALKLHAFFLELSACTQAISNTSIEAMSVLDERAAKALASGLGEIESLTKRVGLLESTDFWADAMIDNKERALAGWSERLSAAYFKIEYATSIAQHLHDQSI